MPTVKKKKRHPRRIDSRRKPFSNRLRSFFNFLHELGVLDTNPAKAIWAPPAEKLFAHSPYTDEQYSKILEQAVR